MEPVNKKISMPQNRVWLSEPFAFQVFGRLLPILNFVMLLGLTYGTFLDWGVNEEIRTKLMVWLAALAATAAVQGLAGTISSGFVEDNIVVITTRFRRHRIPASLVIGVTRFDF